MTRPSTPPAHTDFSRLLDRVDKLERKYTPRGPSRLGDLDDVDDVTPIPGGVVTYDETLGGYKLTDPASAAGFLVFAKQMYGSVNDPGGGAPTDGAWGSDYGGIFSKDIDDPSVDIGGWWVFQLEGNDYNANTRGLDPNADIGYLDEEYYGDNTFGSHVGWYFDYEAYLPAPAPNVLAMRQFQADVDEDGSATVQWWIDAFGGDTSTPYTVELGVFMDAVGQASPSGGYYQLEGGFGTRLKIKVDSTQTRTGVFEVERVDLFDRCFRIRENGELGFMTEADSEAVTYSGRRFPVYDPDTNSLLGYVNLYDA